MNLNRLLNADNECVGYFTDDVAGRAAMQAARAEWDGVKCDACRSVATPIKPLELEDVEPGNGDRVDYVILQAIDYPKCQTHGSIIADARVNAWIIGRGAASVEVQRHEINRYRRPGQSNRSADLGGPAEATGVLYVLLVKAPK